MKVPADADPDGRDRPRGSAGSARRRARHHLRRRRLVDVDDVEDRDPFRQRGPGDGGVSGSSSDASARAVARARSTSTVLSTTPGRRPGRGGGSAARPPPSVSVEHGARGAHRGQQVGHVGAEGDDAHGDGRVGEHGAQGRRAVAPPGAPSATTSVMRPGRVGRSGRWWAAARAAAQAGRVVARREQLDAAVRAGVGQPLDPLPAGGGGRPPRRTRRCRRRRARGASPRRGRPPRPTARTRAVRRRCRDRARRAGRRRRAPPGAVRARRRSRRRRRSLGGRCQVGHHRWSASPIGTGEGVDVGAPPLPQARDRHAWPGRSARRATGAARRARARSATRTRSSTAMAKSATAPASSRVDWVLLAAPAAAILDPVGAGHHRRQQAEEQVARAAEDHCHADRHGSGASMARNGNRRAAPTGRPPSGTASGASSGARGPGRGGRLNAAVPSTPWIIRRRTAAGRSVRRTDRARSATVSSPRATRPARRASAPSTRPAWRAPAPRRRRRRRARSGRRRRPGRRARRRWPCARDRSGSGRAAGDRVRPVPAPATVTSPRRRGGAVGTVGDDRSGGRTSMTTPWRRSATSSGVAEATVLPSSSTTAGAGRPVTRSTRSPIVASGPDCATVTSASPCGVRMTTSMPARTG